MTSTRKICLFLTGGLVLLGIGVGSGFAMRQRHLSDHRVLQTLEVASLQLDHTGRRPNPHQTKAMTLVQAAITEMRASLESR